MKDRLLPHVQKMWPLMRLTYADRSHIEQSKKQALELGYEICGVRENDLTGYYGVAFRGASEIIVSHRGTDSISALGALAKVGNIANLDTATLKNIVLSLRTDVIDDARIALDGNPKQANDAFRFLQDTIEANEDMTVIQIGHSLGGCLAEICHQMLNGQIESYAFDSPGCAAISITTGPKAIHYYMSSPHAINTCLHHLDSGKPNTVFHQMLYPLSQGVSATSLEDYLKTTVALHIGILKQDQSAITVVDIEQGRWPVGLQNGLTHFYSRANKDTWAVLLDKHWKNVCKKLGRDASDEANFDKFFDYFARRCLDNGENKWKYIVPFQNVGEYVQEVEKMPLYIKLFYTPLEIGLSIWASWKNYHTLDNLSSEYIRHLNKHEHKPVSKKGFISDKVSAVFSTIEGFCSGIKIMGHLLWDHSFIPKTWVSSHNKVVAHHNNDNGKLADGGLIVSHQHYEEFSKKSQLHHHKAEEKVSDAGISTDVVNMIGESNNVQPSPLEHGAADL